MQAHRGAADGEDMEPTFPRTRTRGQTKGPRLLVVDDEPSVAASMRLRLRRCDLRDASSVGEAVAILREDQGFDLIVCDVMMPGESGLVLRSWLSRHHPRLLGRFVLMSGGVRDPALRQIIDQEGIPLLDKPFDCRILQRMAEELRDGGAPEPALRSPPPEPDQASAPLG